MMSSGLKAVGPANTAIPNLFGTATSGQTLTATTGTWTGTPTITYSYQWVRGASTNVGTNSSTYTLVGADVGNTMHVTVTATNSAGNANASSANTATVGAIAPANTAIPITPATH